MLPKYLVVRAFKGLQEFMVMHYQSLSKSFFITSTFQLLTWPEGSAQVAAAFTCVLSERVLLYDLGTALKSCCHSIAARCRLKWRFNLLVRPTKELRRYDIRYLVLRFVMYCTSPPFSVPRPDAVLVGDDILHEWYGCCAGCAAEYAMTMMLYDVYEYEVPF